MTNLEFTVHFIQEIRSKIQNKKCEECFMGENYTPVIISLTSCIMDSYTSTVWKSNKRLQGKQNNGY